MILAHKIALDATIKQQRYFSRAAGCDRFVWNLALEMWNSEYKAGRKPKMNELKKQFNSIKYQQYPWMKNIHRDAHADPFARLQIAWNTFFKAFKKGDKRIRPPRFHKKGRKDSFYVSNDKLTMAKDGWSVRISVIGSIRMHEKLRFKGRIMSAVVSRTANQWFISFQVEVGEVKRERTNNKITGVDVGIRNAAVIYSEDGPNIKTEIIAAPNPLKQKLRKLRRMQRSIFRRKKGSNNRRKLIRKVACAHAHIAAIRSDFWHKITTRLCCENQAVGIEDLNVSGMLKNPKLARALSDVGFGEFRRQMTYKAPLYNTHLVLAGRWYPSSKTCCQCGCVKEFLPLSERVFHCDQCGYVQDRDVNASRNLYTLAKNTIPTACGEFTLGDSGVVIPLVEPRTTPCDNLRTK